MSQTFKPGNVVAVQSHPHYLDHQGIIISGDVTNLSPLMVVSEVNLHPKDVHDEVTGEKLSAKGLGHCKCIWYSLKTNSFEEARFPFKSLKLIDKEVRGNIEIADDELLKTGSMAERIKKYRSQFKNAFVLFRTTPHELLKQKITMNFTDKSSSRKSVYNSLLSFICPPLEIIDFKLNTKTNEKKYDPKSGDRTAIFSEIEVKCRYYNGPNAKWSEFFLPIDSLIKLELPSHETIEYIETAIENKTYFRFDTRILEDIIDDVRVIRELTELQIVFEPEELIYLNGLYFLKGSDLIHNKILRFKVTDLFRKIAKDRISDEDLFDDVTYPNFNFEKGQKSKTPDTLFVELNLFLQDAIKAKKYIVLEYLNKRDQLITRTLRNYHTVDRSTERSPRYLYGYCCKKRDNRTFRFRGIQSIKVLNLKMKSKNPHKKNQ